MTEQEKAELLQGGIPCSGMISIDPDTPPESAGCQNMATRWVGSYAWCDACGPEDPMKKRDVRFELRLSTEEYEALGKLADEKGISRADYLRMLVLDKTSKAPVSAEQKTGERLCNVKGCGNSAERTLTSNGMPRFNIGAICEKHWHELYRLIAMDQYYDLKEPVK